MQASTRITTDEWKAMALQFGKVTHRTTSPVMPEDLMF
jgi:hypothetical protein